MTSEWCVTLLYGKIKSRFIMTWWHVEVCPYVSTVLVYIWCSDISIVKQQIMTPCGKLIRYAWKTPHKFLEKFSKNLYGTTGGTYSSRFLRPVMYLCYRRHWYWCPHCYHKIHPKRWGITALVYHLRVNIFFEQYQNSHHSLIDIS